MRRTLLPWCFLPLWMAAMPLANAVSLDPPASVSIRGHSIRIQAGNGKTVVFRARGNPDSDAGSFRRYAFQRHFDEAGYVQLHELENERSDNLIVSLKTGRGFHIHGQGNVETFLSPDRSRIAFVSGCEETDSPDCPVSVRVWKLSHDGAGVLEDRVPVPGFAFIVWVDASTIVLRKDGQPWMRIVREGGRWKARKTAAAPSPPRTQASAGRRRDGLA